MLESVISFSSINLISYFLWIYSQISTNSSNIVFSIIILENLQKIFVNNEKLEWWEIETNNWIWKHNHPKVRFWTSTLKSVNVSNESLSICPQNCMLSLTTLNSRSVPLNHLSLPGFVIFTTSYKHWPV